MAAYDEARVAELLANAGIIRNRLKINAAIQNARAFLKVQKEFGSFNAYLWSFCPQGKPIQGVFRSLADVPVTTDIADRLSQDLIKRGFKFVGPVIMCSFMHAVGMMNGHLVSCFRHKELFR